MGERISSIGVVMPAATRASIVSMRESPIESIPAAVQVRTISGRPRLALLTAVTLMPRLASCWLRLRAL